MPTAAKSANVALLADLIQPAQCLVVTDHTGQKTATMSELRQQLQATDATYRVVKNTLMLLAAKQAGAAELEPLLHGPSSVVFCSDDIGASVRVLRDFIRTNRVMTVRGGLLGDQRLTADEVMALANLPGRQQLRAGLVASIQGPLAQLVGLLGPQGPAAALVGTLTAASGSLVRVLDAREAQLEGAAAGG